MDTITVNMYGQAYIPNNLREEGYTGEMEVIHASCALVIRKPNSELKDVIKSLQILQMELEHRLEMEQKPNISVS